MEKAQARSAQQLLTVPQAAQALSLSVYTLRTWIAKRRIGVVRLGGAVRIPLGEVERLISIGTSEPNCEPNERAS